MKSYLKGILLFNINGEKRKVQLEQGINIITGESKTGKSALVEIIDYCLCSSRCTVPKGIITDFAEIYAIILSINDCSYIVARQRWLNGGKMLFEEVSNSETVDSLEYSFFDKQFMSVDAVKEKIEKALGLNISNTATDLNDKKKKASLRSMKCMEYKGCRVPELFEQGLMSDTPDYLEQFELEQLKKMRR